MHYTYVLLCSGKITKFYIGSCSDLVVRLKNHKTKSVQTTKKYDKIKLIYYEACLNKTDARKREIQLKTGFGRGYLKTRLKEYLKRGIS